MKFYKNNAGAVFAYAADGSQDAFISPTLTAITQADADTLRGPTLAQAQAAQAATVSAACQVAITAGVTSGTYTYPTKTTDQTNLAAAVNLSTIPGNAASWTVPIMCQSAGGTWVRVPHTAAQVQKAGQDVFMQILSLLMRNDVLAAQIAAAGSVAIVQSITW